MIIGSIANVMPSREQRTAARLAEIGDLRVLVHGPAHPVADEAAHDGEPGLLGDRLHGVRDVREPPSRPALSTPASSATWPTSSSRSASAEISPTAKVNAESATKPPRVTPTSTDRMSPSPSAYAPGMPWTTMSFGDAQIEAGSRGSP